ncbi:MAG: radical SAM protein [Candidatus Omnitrophota bacterium]
MRIAILNIFREDLAEKRYDRPNFPDPSLGSLYSYLKKHGIESYPIDSKLERLDLKRTAARIRPLDAEVIGFTSFTHEIERVASAAELIRGSFPNAKFVIGGAHANAVPKETLEEFGVFDVAVYGEAEESICALLKDGFRDPGRIKGIAFRRDGAVVLNEPAASLDPAGIPIADWGPFPKALYYPVFTSRGCNHGCVFCARPFGSRVRFRPIEDVAEEVDRVTGTYKPRYLYFWDENFCASKERTMTLLDMLRKRRRKTEWFAQAHVDNLDLDLLKAMKSSGCIRLGIGIESGNEAILGNIGKGIDKEKVRRAVGRIKKAGIPYEGYFLLGLPNETRQTCKDTIDFASELNPDFPVFGIAVPYPGTKIREMALKGSGGYKLISGRWRDYNKIAGAAMELEGLSRREIEELQFSGYLAVLLRNFRVLSMLRFFIQYFHDICFCLKKYCRRGVNGGARQ